MQEAFALEAGDKDILRLTQLDPLRFLGSPGLWTGLLARRGIPRRGGPAAPLS